MSQIDFAHLGPAVASSEMAEMMLVEEEIRLGEAEFDEYSRVRDQFPAFFA